MIRTTKISEERGGQGDMRDFQNEPKIEFEWDT